jgi:hypothetical protein
MKSKILASAVRVLSLLLLVSGTCALAQESGARADRHEPQGLVGTWRLQVTPVYCPGVTTVTLAAPSQGLVSFTGDGTMTNNLHQHIVWIRYSRPRLLVEDRRPNLQGRFRAPDCRSSYYKSICSGDAENFRCHHTRR